MKEKEREGLNLLGFFPWFLFLIFLLWAWSVVLNGVYPNPVYQERAIQLHATQYRLAGNGR